MSCSGFFVYLVRVKGRLAKLVPVFISIAVIGIVCLLELFPRFSFGFAQRIEWITYDLRMRSIPAKSASANTSLAFVFISDDSITTVSDGSLGYKYGLYWPRHIYGRMLKELAAERCKAVGFDVLFGELRADHAPVPMPDNSLLESDEFFARELKSNPTLLAATPSLVPPDLFRTNCLSLSDISAEKDADGVLRRAKAFSDIHLWHPILSQLAREAGFDLNKIEIHPDKLLFHLPGERLITSELNKEGRLDVADLVQKITGEKPTGPLPVVQPFETRRVWQLGIAMAALQMGADLSKATIETNLITIRGSNTVVKLPVDSRHRFYIDWTLRYDDSRLTVEPIESLLQKQNERAEGKTPESLLTDKLVFVGSTATGNDLTDRGATPLDNDTFLVSAYWNIANSILNHQFITRTSTADSLGLICGMAVIAALLTWKLRAISGTICIFLLMTTYSALAFWVFHRFRLWLPMVLPVFGALFMTYVLLVTWRAFYEQREKRHVKAVFSKMVSPNIVSELLRVEKLSLHGFNGARREITVFFADVRGFTQLTDVNYAKAQEYVREAQLPKDQAEAFFDQQAKDTLETVNLYLSTIADIIKKHNGTLDKYIGDCVMAFWGAPTANEQHALYGVRAAVDAQRAIFELNERRALENEQREKENLERIKTGQRPLDHLPLLALGTGINSGEAIVGLMGSDAHIVSYTVFGREVNLASRLEGVSGRSRIIISENTFRDLKRDDPKLAATCVELEAVKVKGIADAVKIYEVPWKRVDNIDGKIG